MTQELDKNGKPKIYCKNCGKRMAHTANQQYFGTTGYTNHYFWKLRDIGEVYTNREEANAQLQRLTNAGHRWRGYVHEQDEPLRIATMHPSYQQDGSTLYYVEYTERVSDPIDFQFHSQNCMLEFLRRPDIIAQMLPIIDAHKAEPIVPAAKPRKKRVIKSTILPSYAELDAKLGGM